MRAKLEAGEFEELDGGRLRVDGHELSPEEVIVERRGKEGWAVAGEDGLTVALDLALDPELELEGRAREAIHQVNTMRKEAGLEITDRIALTLPPELAAHEEWIARETLASRVEPGGELADREGLADPCSSATARARMSRSARWSAGRARRRSRRAARSSPPAPASRSSTPAAVSVSAFTRRSPSALRRSTRPRASRRSTSPVTFEASQKSRSASALIGIGCSGSSMRKAWACAKPSPSSAELRRRPSRAGPCRSRRRAAAPRARRSLGHLRRHCSHVYLRHVGS